MLEPLAFLDRIQSSARSRPWPLPVFLLLLFTGAFLVRVWGISYFHYWDEMVYLQDAKVICCGKTNYSELFFRPPLLSVLLAGVFLIRDSLFAVCVVTAALNALAPVFLFVSGRRIVGALPSMLASVLLAFGPFFVGVFPPGFDSDDTGNSLLTDSPALTLVLLGLWLMLKALEKQRPERFALAGFALSLAVLMRFGSVPSVGPVLLLALLAKKRVKALAATAIGLLAGLGPYLLWSRTRLGGYFETLQEGWKNVEGPEPPFTFYLAHAPAIFTWLALIGLLIAAVAALLSLYRFLLSKSARVADFMFTATPDLLMRFLWLWLLVDFVFFSRMPHKEPRYVMPLAPPLLLLSGYGLAFFCKFQGRFLQPIATLSLAAAMVVTLLPSASRLSGPLIVRDRPDEMTASAFLNSSFPENTPIYMNFNYPAFAYNTNFAINVLPIGGPEVYQAIDRMPPGALLVAYRENESGEPRIDLLNRDAALEVLKEYATLVIYRRRTAE